MKLIYFDRYPNKDTKVLTIEAYTEEDQKLLDKIFSKIQEILLEVKKRKTLENEKLPAKAI